MDTEMKESIPLPEIAVSAFNLLDANFQRSAQDLGTQAYKLRPEGEGWSVNWNTKMFERDVTPEPTP